MLHAACVVPRYVICRKENSTSSFWIMLTRVPELSAKRMNCRQKRTGRVETIGQQEESYEVDEGLRQMLDLSQCQSYLFPTDRGII